AIAEADVGIVSLRILTRTDTLGHFSMKDVRPGELEVSVRRLGYDPASVALTLAAGAVETVTVVMHARAEVLAGVEVTDRRRQIAIEDFYRRRIRGQGNFITRDDIEARHASRLSDALSGVPGLTLVRRSVHGGMAVRFVTASIARKDCVPQYWLD